MNKGFREKIFSFLFSNFKLILIVYLFIFIFSLFFSSKLKFESDFEALLPKSFESVKSLNDITKEFGGTGYLVLDVKSNNLEKSKEFSQVLVKQLEKLPEIKYINWRQPKKYFDNRKLLYMDLEDLKTIKKRIKKKINFEKQKSNPLFIDLLDEKYELDFSDIEKKYEGNNIFRDYYVSKDNKELILLIKPNGLAGNLDFSKNLIAKINEIIKEINPKKYDSSIEVLFTGRYKKQIDLNDQLKRDLKLTGMGSMILVALLLILYFRQLRPLFLIGFSIWAGLSITFALTYFFIGYVNIISAFLISILMGISADYGIVLYSRYTEERLSNLNAKEAVIKMLKNTCEPIIVSGLTTGLVFFSLLLAEFKGFSQFGFIAGMGVFLNMFVFFTLFPATILLFEKIKPAEYTEILKLKFKHKKMHIYIPVLIFSLIITSYALIKIKNIKFEYNFSKIQGSNIPSFILDEKINKIIGMSLTPDLVMVDNLKDLKEIENVLKEKKKNPDTTIDNYASILSFIPENQKEKIKILREIKKILDDSSLNILKGEQKKKVDETKKLLEVKEIKKDDLPKEILRMFYGKNPNRSAFFIFPKVDLSDVLLVSRSSDEIRDLKLTDKTLHPVSESIIFSDIINMIKKDGKTILPLALILTALPIIIAYRSLTATIFILLPLFTGFIWIFAIMVFFGIKFNFFNVIVLPLIFGLGDDYGEYIYSRYMEEGKGSIPFVLIHTGPAVAMSALVTSIGFGTLLFANHNGLKSIGFVAVTGIFCVFVSSIMLMPSLITLLEKLRKNKNGK